MNYNERGGILSKLFIIPVGVALMVGFFFLGYYVGKYQSKSVVRSENAIPLPEIVSKNLPKPDEFTFYKTLTDKGDKTVSIDLKPKPPAGEKQPERTPIRTEPVREKTAPQPKQDKKIELKVEREKTAVVKQPEPKLPAPVKKEAPSTNGQNAKLRYSLQIASYQEKEMAEEDVKKMKQRGYAAFVVASELPGKGTWYRVRLGSFINKKSAEKLQKELQAKEGIAPFITLE